MDKLEQKFTVGTRVKLRDGVDPSFYNGFSRVGNEGWVRKRKRDKYGYGQIFIEWDKHAWAYNGTEDGWTHEGHFEAVEESKMNEPTSQNNQKELEDTVRGITENFVKTLFGAMGASVEQIEDEPVMEVGLTKTEDDSNDWENLAAEAAKAIVNAPAYFVIALEHLHAPGAPPLVIPRVFHAAQESEQALIVQSQIAHILANLQDATISKVLEQRANEHQVANEDQ